MRIGYARVSTETQEIARQTRAFNELGIEKVFIDKASGKNAEREQLKAMLHSQVFRLTVTQGGQQE